MIRRYCKNGIQSAIMYIWKQKRKTVEIRITQKLLIFCHNIFKEGVNKMGVTFGSKRASVDLTYSGMFYFRLALAKLYSDELANHYEKMPGSLLAEPEDRDRYKAKTELIREKISKQDEYGLGEALIRFLYYPDAEGKLNRTEVRLISALMERSEDHPVCKSEENFGYKSEPVFFFKLAQIFADARSHNCCIRWF